MGVLRQNVVRLNVFIINNIHGGEFKVRSLWESNVIMLRLARIRHKEFLRTTSSSATLTNSSRVIPHPLTQIRARSL